MNDYSRKYAKSSSKFVTKNNLNLLKNDLFNILLNSIKSAGRSYAKKNLINTLNIIYKIKEEEIKKDMIIEFNNDYNLISSDLISIRALSAGKLWKKNREPIWFSMATADLQEKLNKESDYSNMLTVYRDMTINKKSDYFIKNISAIAFKEDEWWERNAKEINFDIGIIFNEKFNATGIDDIISLIPDQTPAPSRFIFSEKIKSIPLENTADKEQVNDFLGELNTKTNRLYDRISKTNTDPYVCETIKDFLDALPARFEELNPRILLSRSTGIKACAGAFASQRGELELFDGAVAQIVDVAATADLLLACYPEIIEIETRAAELNIIPNNARTIKTNLDTVRRNANSSSIVDESANKVLNEQAEITERQLIPEAFSKQTARYALTIRNFMTILSRYGLMVGIDCAAEGKVLAKEIWLKARPKFIEGAADGAGAMGRPAAVIAVASLISAVAGPTAAIAAAAAGFGRVDQFMKMAEKYLLEKRLSEAQENLPDQPVAEEQNLTPPRDDASQHAVPARPVRPGKRLL